MASRASRFGANHAFRASFLLDRRRGRAQNRAYDPPHQSRLTAHRLDVPLAPAALTPREDDTAVHFSILIQKPSHETIEKSIPFAARIFAGNRCMAMLLRTV